MESTKKSLFIMRQEGSEATAGPRSKTRTLISTMSRSRSKTRQFINTMSRPKTKTKKLLKTISRPRSKIKKFIMEGLIGQNYLPSKFGFCLGFSVFGLAKLGFEL